MKVTGIYTTAEQGQNRDFYQQAAAELGPAIAHNSGGSTDAKSAKFLNQEEKLQERKRELKAEAEKEAERREASERAAAKSEKVAARREKQLLKKAADLDQLILYIFQNQAKFPEFTRTQHRRAMLGEYQKPKKNKSFEPTPELVEDNTEAILARLGTQ